MAFEGGTEGSERIHRGCEGSRDEGGEIIVEGEMGGDGGSMNLDRGAGRGRFILRDTVREGGRESGGSERERERETEVLIEVTPKQNRKDWSGPSSYGV